MFQTRSEGMSVTAGHHGRFAHIDSIRAVAAIGVVYFHCIYEYATLSIPMSAFDRMTETAFLHVLDLGKVCVILFFFVSGFVIPNSLLKPVAHPARDFVVGRLFRMYPAYWISIPAGIGATLLAGRGHFSMLEILFNATMLQQFFGIPNVIGLYWTLQIEIVFYAVCLATFLAGRLGDRRAIMGLFAVMLLGALALAGLRFATGKGLPVALPLSLAVMFLGFLYRKADDRVGPFGWRPLAIAIAVFLVALPPILYLAYRGETGIGASWQRYVVTYYSATAAFFLLTRTVRLTGRILPYLGKISYSIYLFGAVMQLVLLGVLPRSWLAGHLQLFALMVVLVTILVAIPLYHLVEEPGIRAGRRLLTRLDHGRVARPEIEAV